MSRLSRVKQREGATFSHLLRQRPLSAFQQLGTLQKALLTSGLSDESEQDLHTILLVLSYHAYAEALQPVHAKSSTLDNVMFWDACVELEVPLLLAELIGSDALFSMARYCKHTQKPVVVGI